MPAERQSLFLDRLRECQLLEPAQLEELAGLPEARASDPQALARLVFRRGWLSRYQLNQVGQGKAKELRIGPYILVEVLGEGGMGQVFKAHHQHMERVVALKVIRKDRLANGDLVKRFYQEVKAAAALTHPNIVMAYDAGPAGNTHYFAMEYIEGVDLSRLVKDKGPLPVPLACDYIRQAALGLQHAHERGLVHRDIKPANLLLNDQQGKKAVVKVLDMGLARFQGGEREKGLTQTGQLLGTPDYLAPEQAMDSHAADIRADIYSLGCSLYYLLAGKAPFSGETLTQVLLQHQIQEPPLIANRSDLPEGLQETIHKMIAKQPDDRYQTPAEVAEVLAPFAGGETQNPSVFAALAETPGKSKDKAWNDTLEGEESASRSVSRKNVTSGTMHLAAAAKKGKGKPPSGSNRTLILASAIGGGVVLLFLLVLVVWLAIRPGPTAVATGPNPPQVQGQGKDGPEKGPGKDRGKPPDPVVVKPPDPIKPPNPGVPPGPAGTLIDAAILAEGEGLGVSGRRLVFSADGRLVGGHSNVRVSVWDLSNNQNICKIPLLPQGGFTAIALSSDGRQVLVGTRGKAAILYEVATGNELKRFGTPAEVSAVALSADGRYAAAGCGPSKEKGFVLMWELATGKEVLRTQPFQEPIEEQFVALSFSSDSKRLLLGEGRNYFVYQIESKSETAGTWPGSAAVSVSFGGDGRLALVGKRSNDAQLFDLQAGRLLATLPLVDKLETLQYTIKVALTPDGKRAVVGCSIGRQNPGNPPVLFEGTVRLIDLESLQELGRTEQLGEHVIQVAIAPDGTRAVYATSGPQRKVHLLDLTRPGPRAGPVSQAVPRPPPPPAVPGKTTIDLVPLIDPAKDTVLGSWEVKDNVLVAPKETDWQRLEIPYRPAEEYDFVVVFSQPKLRFGVALIMPNPKGGSFWWEIGGASGRRYHLGVRNTIETFVNPKFLEANTVYTTVVQVRRDGVHCLLNGQELVKHETDYRDLADAGGYKLRDATLLGVCSADPTFYHHVRLVEITGSGKKAR